MPKNLRFAFGILSVTVLLGLVTLRDLHDHVQRMTVNQKTEGEERREVLAPPITTPTDVKIQAKIFWAAGPDKVAPVEVELPLSADPVQRAKQVLNELISDPPTPEQRVLPGDAVLLDFYVLPDGTAIADFSDALVTEIPSGIASEQAAVESITETLAANVPSLRRLKILIHGQEVDTLAGHLDLTGFFDLLPAASPASPSSAPSTQSSSSSSSAPGQRTVAPSPPL
jgi:hypothetical protein